MYSVCIDRKAPHNWNYMISSGSHAIGNSSEMGLFNCALRVMPLFVTVYDEKGCVAKWIIYKRRFEKKELLAYTFPDVSSQNDYNDIFGIIINELSERFKDQRLIIRSYTFARNTDKELLLNHNFYNIKAFTTYISEISDNNDNIISAFRKTHKQDTKKALSEGYEYRHDIPIKEYYDLSVETYLRSNQKPSMSIKRLKRFKSAFKNSGIISGVYVKGKLQAASVVPFIRGNTAVYYHGASSNEKERGVTTLLQYMNMVYLRDNYDIRVYDFTGTSIDIIENEVVYTDAKASSLDQFKRRFGGIQQIHYVGEVLL